MDQNYCVSRPSQTLSSLSSLSISSKPREVLKFDQVRQRLDAEFKEKISKKVSPVTLPKPIVAPRRSSLQFTADQFLSEKTEKVRTSRKSVGDIFGERMTCRSSEPSPGRHNLLRLVREFSGDQSQSQPPAPASMLRSATWVGGEVSSFN